MKLIQTLSNGKEREFIVRYLDEFGNSITYKHALSCVSDSTSDYPVLLFIENQINETKDELDALKEEGASIEDIKEKENLLQIFQEIQEEGKGFFIAVSDGEVCMNIDNKEHWLKADSSEDAYKQYLFKNYKVKFEEEE